MTRPLSAPGKPAGWSRSPARTELRSGSPFVSLPGKTSLFHQDSSMTTREASRLLEALATMSASTVGGMTMRSVAALGRMNARSALPPWFGRRQVGTVCETCTQPVALRQKGRASDRSTLLAYLPPDRPACGVADSRSNGIGFLAGFGALRCLSLGAMLASLACASAPIKPEGYHALARADGLVLDGCYDCLLEARTVYEGLAVGRARPMVLPRLFQTELLLVLREKELALPSDSTLARAGAIAAELPASFNAQRYVEIIGLVPEDSLGASKLERDTFRRRNADASERVDGLLAWLEADSLGQAFRRYVSGALHCSYLVRGGRLGRRPPLLAPGADLAGVPPLVAYKAATCGLPRRDALERIHEQVPRFVETALYLGQLELPLVPYNGPARARPLFQGAYGRFPRSPAVTYLNGRVYETAGDCVAALRYYRETNALREAHERALLGQTVCLTSLKEPDQAIQTATRLIELGGPTEGEAWYWRAWNRYRLRDSSGARADIDRAKSLQRTGEILTLAGMIEHDWDEPDLAEQDLDNALQLNDQNCTAMRYLGMVRYKRGQWLAAATRFADATLCHDGSARDAERQLRAVADRVDWEPDFKALRIAALEARVKEQRAQESAAAVNGAANFLRAGDVGQAQAYVDRAARDPERAAAVRELQELIGALRRPRPHVREPFGLAHGQGSRRPGLAVR